MKVESKVEWPIMVRRRSRDPDVPLGHASIITVVLTRRPCRGGLLCQRAPVAHISRTTMATLEVEEVIPSLLIEVCVDSVESAVKSVLHQPRWIR
jgi:hypothetical protein